MNSRLLWIVLVALVSSPIRAAELTIRGPVGAELSIDDQFQGVLPLTQPIELDAGSHVVRLKHRDHRPYTQEIRLAPSGSLALSIELAPLFRSSAVGSSLLLAGMGQLYENRPLAGYIFMGAQIGAALTAIFAEATFKERRDDVARAQYAYDRAISAEDLALWRAELDRSYGKMEDVGNLRDGAVIAVAALAVLSAVEAWWRFPAVDLSASPSDAGLMLGIGAQF